VPPGGFHRIRHYGLFANAGRADNIAQARQLLDVRAAHVEPAIPAARATLNRGRSRILARAAAGA